jgi:hypothetical protein
VKWPFVTRRVHELEIARWAANNLVDVEARNAARVERDYWRDRAEKLIDQALVKRGEITHQVMEERKPQAGDPITSAVALMAQKEFESVPVVGPAKVS